MAMANNHFWYRKEFYVQKKGVAMGARYAPIEANLIMDMWEDEYIYGQNIPQLRFYRRYIDDLIILWDGSAESLEDFMKQLDTNIYGITFTGKWHTNSIDYLDLQIFKYGGE